MAFTYITLGGTCKKADGTAARGSIRFTPSEPMRNGDVVVAAPVTATLTSSGVIAVDLAAVDDDGTEPEGVTYLVEELLVGQRSRSYHISVPNTPASMDLADIVPVLAGTPYTQYLTQAAADDRYAPIDIVPPEIGLTNDPGPLEGMTLYAYGHSYNNNNHNTGSGAAGSWCSRIASRRRMTFTSRAVDGTSMRQTAVAALLGASAWVPNTRGLATLCCTVNDVAALGTNAAGVRGYAHSARAFLAATRAKQKVAAATSQWVYSADWEKSTTSAAFASGRFQTVTEGAYCEVNVTGQVCDIIATLRDTGSGVYTIAKDGSTIATMDLSATVATDYTATAISLTGLGSGTHTIRITLTSGDFLGVDGLFIPSETPPPVVVLGEGAVPTYAPSLASTWLPELETVVADFPHAIYVPAEPDWDGSVMLNADEVHPNDHGASYLATKVLDTLDGLPLDWTNGLNLIGTQPTYTAPTAPSTPGGGQAGGGSGPGGLSGDITDSFTRIDSGTDPGTTETGSAAWTVSGTSVWGISAEQLICTSSSSSGVGDCNIDTGESDGTAEVVFVTVSSSHPSGLNVRCSSDFQTGYVAWNNGSNYSLHRRTGGTSYTSLGSSTGVTPTAGDVVSVVCSGSSITVKVNGSTVIGPVTDATYTDTYWGVWGPPTGGQTFDDFTFTA